MFRVFRKIVSGTDQGAELANEVVKLAERGLTVTVQDDRGGAGGYKLSVENDELTAAQIAWLKRNGYVVVVTYSTVAV